MIPINTILYLTAIQRLLSDIHQHQKIKNQIKSSLEILYLQNTFRVLNNSFARSKYPLKSSKTVTFIPISHEIAHKVYCFDIYLYSFKSNQNPFFFEPINQSPISTVNWNGWNVGRLKVVNLKWRYIKKRIWEWLSITSN